MISANNGGAKAVGGIMQISQFEVGSNLDYVQGVKMNLPRRCNVVDAFSGKPVSQKKVGKIELHLDCPDTRVFMLHDYHRRIQDFEKQPIQAIVAFGEGEAFPVKEPPAY